MKRRYSSSERMRPPEAPAWATVSGTLRSRLTIIKSSTGAACPRLLGERELQGVAQPIARGHEPGSVLKLDQGRIHSPAHDNSTAHTLPIPVHWTLAPSPHIGHARAHVSPPAAKA